MARTKPNNPNNPPKVNGGARPNSGPKKGAVYAKTVSKELAREAVRAIIMRHMEPMLQAQVANAMGIKYLVARHKATGKFTKLTEETAKLALDADNPDAPEVIEVWEKDPSVQAFTDLANRALDKPKEQEQDFNVQGALVIKHEMADDA